MADGQQALQPLEGDYGTRVITDEELLHVPLSARLDAAQVLEAAARERGLWLREEYDPVRRIRILHWHPQGEASCLLC